MLRGSIVGVLALSLVFAAAQKDEERKEAKAVVFRGARIHTAAGPVIDDGVLIVRAGKIVAVGPAGRVEVPKDADVRDAAGEVGEHRPGASAAGERDESVPRLRRQLNLRPCTRTRPSGIVRSPASFAVCAHSQCRW